jgi:hypothetical protein
VYEHSTRSVLSLVRKRRSRKFVGLIAKLRESCLTCYSAVGSLEAGAQPRPVLALPCSAYSRTATAPHRQGDAQHSTSLDLQECAGKCSGGRTMYGYCAPPTHHVPQCPRPPNVRGEPNVSMMNAMNPRRPSPQTYRRGMMAGGHASAPCSACTLTRESCVAFAAQTSETPHSPTPTVLPLPSHSSRRFHLTYYFTIWRGPTAFVTLCCSKGD